MDGVTDMAYRELQALIGKPDVIFTEFIPVEGIVRLQMQLLKDFWYSANQRPVVAQIYGHEPELFYSAAQLVCELGFDGVDINMGCPARSVVHRGSGAALIRTPDLAVEIIESVKAGVKDWQEQGINWQRWPVIEANVARDRLQEFYQWSKVHGVDYSSLSKELSAGRQVPVSVKTRIGFEKPVVEQWIPKLLDTNISALTLHGRTLKQLYTGQASWDEIAKAVTLRNQIQQSANDRTLLLGNGDVQSRQDALQRVATSGVDGVLIGRGSFGNPWVFLEKDLLQTEEQSADLQTIVSAMLLHSELHEKYKPGNFINMRKNLAWYIKAFPGASKLRAELVRVNDLSEVRPILQKHLGLHYDKISQLT